MKPFFATLIAFSLCLPAVAQDKPKTLGPIAGSGTGFFITADGYLLTNHHVVEGARDISIKTEKGVLRAKVVKVDKKNDLAVLKVEGKFSALPLLSSRKVGLGEKIFTVGFPRPKVQGFSPKITDGIISSLAGIQDDPRDFQISVPVQPGNSGGPLVDQYGNVIGVIVSKLSAKYLLLKNRGNVDLPENVNYAIKGTFALGFMESLPRVAAGLKDPYSRDKERKFSVVVNEVREATVPILVGSYVSKVKIGTPIWEFETGSWVRSSPAIGPDGTVYVGSYDKKLYAIDPKSGVKLWEFQTGAEVHSSPATGSDGTVYVGSKDTKLYAINGKSGVKLWEFKTGAAIGYSTPAIGPDGTVYVGSTDKKLYAINGKSGVKLWEFETGDSLLGVDSSPAIGSDGTVYVGSHDKKLYALSGKSGVKLWEFKTGAGGDSSPAIGPDGTVYVGAEDKKLYALKTDSHGLAKSPWPMRGQNARHTGRVMKK